MIAKFLETTPHIAKVHMILNKIWAFGDKSQKLDVHSVDETTMRIRIENVMVRDKVVRRGMWNIAGVPMIVSKWAPEEDKKQANLIPLWVHLKNFPLSMYSWEGLSFMTSAVGIPDRLHPDTLACKDMDVAKIFVKADLTKEMPKRITYTIQGEEVTVDYAFPWLPPKCISCGKWGHYETFCSLNKKENGKKLEGGSKGMDDEDTQTKGDSNTKRSEVQESANMQEKVEELSSENKKDATE